MDKQELMDILEAGSAATIIIKVFSTKQLYSKDVDHTELLRIMNVASQILQDSLKKEVWNDYRSKFQAPVYENILPPPIIMKILEISTNLLKEYNILELGENLSKELEELFKHMDEIMIFDCKFPSSEIIPLFNNHKRYLMLLQKYWGKYLNIIQSLGTSPLVYRPNPLSRFILNLEYRIQYCVEQIGDENLLSSYRNMSLDPVASEDFGIDWDCGGQEMAMEFDKTINQVVMKTGIRHFDLTKHEEMFLEVCDDALEAVDKRTTEAWKKILAHSDKEAEEKQDKSHTDAKPSTCSEYIKKVENTLRDLVKRVYKNNFAEEWLNKIRSVLTESVYLEALERMKNRKVAEPEEILYFTYLKDVYTLIAQEWVMFKHCFSIKRNQFNSLMSIIIKGRTEEAHNRPEHLWPKIEQERTKVACHDLLEAINKNDKKMAF